MIYRMFITYMFGGITTVYHSFFLGYLFWIVISILAKGVHVYCVCIASRFMHISG